MLFGLSRVTVEKIKERYRCMFSLFFPSLPCASFGLFAFNISVKLLFFLYLTCLHKYRWCTYVYIHTRMGRCVNSSFTHKCTEEFYGVLFLFINCVPVSLLYLHILRQCTWVLQAVLEDIYFLFSLHSQNLVAHTEMSLQSRCLPILIYFPFIFLRFRIIYIRLFSSLILAIFDLLSDLTGPWSSHPSNQNREP